MEKHKKKIIIAAIIILLAIIGNFIEPETENEIIKAENETIELETNDSKQSTMSKIKSHILPSAPMTEEALEKISLNMIALMGDRDIIGNHVLIRELLTKSFQKYNWSFVKTVDKVATNPQNAQSNGGWYGFLLALVIDIPEDQLGTYYTPEETQALIKLKNAM